MPASDVPRGCTLPLRIWSCLAARSNCISTILGAPQKADDLAHRLLRAHPCSRVACARRGLVAFFSLLLPSRSRNGVEREEVCRKQDVGPQELQGTGECQRNGSRQASGPF